MARQRQQTIELEIEKITFGGKGLARCGGLVFFVDGAVPGDRVMARTVRRRKDYVEARVLEFIETSPDRVPAPCPYAGHCGGCQWQQVGYTTQLRYKQEVLLECLQRIGGFTEIRVETPLPSPRVFGYRNKMEFSFSDRVWLLPEEMGASASPKAFALGLHVPGTFDKVIDVKACLLQHRDGTAILETVREWAGRSGLPVYGLRSHQGFWRFLTLRHSEAEDQWMVNLVTAEAELTTMTALARELHARCPTVATVVNSINTRRAAIAVGEREQVLSGPGTIQDRVGPFCFTISPGSFFQTNTRGAEVLYDTVVAYADLHGREDVLDLYSGTGTIPIFLASKAKSVTGIEITPSAVRDADANCRAFGIDNCRFVCGDLRDELGRIRLVPDVVVIDPPRAGMHGDVLKGVLALDSPRIVYVSCNPATLARDLQLLGERYHVAAVQPVDLFPHTFHIEAVVRLERRRPEPLTA